MTYGGVKFGIFAVTSFLNGPLKGKIFANYQNLIVQIHIAKNNTHLLTLEMLQKYLQKQENVDCGLPATNLKNEIQRTLHTFVSLNTLNAEMTRM